MAMVAPAVLVQEAKGLTEQLPRPDDRTAVRKPASRVCAACTLGWQPASHDVVCSQCATGCNWADAANQTLLTAASNRRQHPPTGLGRLIEQDGEGASHAINGASHHLGLAKVAGQAAGGAGEVGVRVGGAGQA